MMLHHDPIAQRPVIAATRAGAGCPHHGAPQNHHHVVHQNSPGKATGSREVGTREAAETGRAWVELIVTPFLSYPANSLARWVERITALIKVTRRPPSSSSRIPSIVQPAGVVTASFSNAG